jgi:hypothetical protein
MNYDEIERRGEERLIITRYPTAKNTHLWRRRVFSTSGTLARTAAASRTAAARTLARAFSASVVVSGPIFIAIAIPIPILMLILILVSPTTSQLALPPPKVSASPVPSAWPCPNLRQSTPEYVWSWSRGHRGCQILKECLLNVRNGPPGDDAGWVFDRGRASES